MRSLSAQASHHVRPLLLQRCEHSAHVSRMKRFETPIGLPNECSLRVSLISLLNTHGWPSKRRFS